MSWVEEPPLRTSADDIVDLVRKHGKMSIDDVGKTLKVPTKVIQPLIDFLVEERIIGIEYKFTTPYIFMSTEKKEKQSYQVPNKKEFYDSHQRKGTPPSDIEQAWKAHMARHIPYMKEEFMQKAILKGIPIEKREQLWQKYLTYVM